MNIIYIFLKIKKLGIIIFTLKKIINRKLMGCKCNNSNLDQNTEMKPEIISLNQIENNNNNNDLIKIEEEKYMHKYSTYPEKIVELINKIRQNPKDYADIIEESIKNIIIEDNNDFEPNKPKIIYKDKLKVALTRGEPAFREAAKELKNMSPIPPLEFKNDICIPMPDNEEEFRDSNSLRKKVQEILSKKITINVFFKELVKIPEISALLMIVDDNGKNSGKKRKAILNKNYKYIGVSYRFIGKKFISYFSFSK